MRNIDLKSGNAAKWYMRTLLQALTPKQKKQPSRIPRWLSPKILKCAEQVLQISFFSKEFK